MINQIHPRGVKSSASDGGGAHQKTLTLVPSDVLSGNLRLLMNGGRGEMNNKVFEAISLQCTFRKAPTIGAALSEERQATNRLAGIHPGDVYASTPARVFINWTSVVIQCSSPPELPYIPEEEGRRSFGDLCGPLGCILSALVLCV